MPITVKHDPGGGDISGLAQLMAMAGAMQAQAPQAPIAPVGPQRPSWPGAARPASAASRYGPSNAGKLTQIRAARAEQERDIQANADMQKQAAGDDAAKMALEHGLDEEIREQALADNITEMQEQARVDASQMEYKFDTEQRREFAKMNRARQFVIDNEQFSDADKASALRQIDLQQAQIQPSMMPRDPNAPQYPEGQGPQDSWVDPESGAIMGLDRSGNRRMLVPYDKTRKGIDEERQYEAAAADLELQAKRQDKLLDMRRDLMTEPIIEGEGDDKTMRTRTPEEVDKIMQGVVGIAQPTQQAAQKPWWEDAEAGGMKVTESDRQLPDEVGFAQAFIRDMSGKPGGYDALTDDEKKAWDNAKGVLLRFRQQVGRITGG